jgi:hypothetical protein
MSAEATKKSTAATAETIDEVYHEAMCSYEKALKSGIQLQEESVNLWKDLLTKLGLPRGVPGEARVDDGGRFPAGSQAYGGVCRDVQPHEQSDD